MRAEETRRTRLLAEDTRVEQLLYDLPWKQHPVCEYRTSRSKRLGSYLQTRSARAGKAAPPRSRTPYVSTGHHVGRAYAPRGDATS
eukprot:1369483-Rhodomonas_salina.1